MGDSAAHRTLLPPSQGSFASPTPSGLTPTTRSEAEAALMRNATQQTDSAAPAVPPGLDSEATDSDADGLSEAQRAYRRPAGGRIRTSSTNYEEALKQLKGEESVSSNVDDDTPANADNTSDMTGLAKVASPTSSSSAHPFPPPGQGVVPLHTGIGAAPQAAESKKTRNGGLSLGQLGRQQSWSEQDKKHVLQKRLMTEVKGEAGYDSEANGGAER